MISVILTLALLLSADDPAQSQTPRKPNPFAPSLPLLTDEEEENLDRIIDRFILADTGKLKGDEAKKALSEFSKLGSEAIPALIRGVNRAAAIEHSCPVVLIAKKLGGMLRASNDPEVLEFARENVGASVKATKQKGVLNELRVLSAQRKSSLARAALLVPRTPPGKSVNTTGPTTKEPRQMTVAELVAAAGSERGARLQAVLSELGNRSGDDVIAALGTAATAYEGEIQQLAREQLDRVMGKLSPETLKAKLKDDRPEVRAAATRAQKSGPRP